MADGPLSTTDLATFRRRGWVVLRAAFDPAPLAAQAEAELAELVAQSAAESTDAGDGGGPAEDSPPAARHHLRGVAQGRFDVKSLCPRVHGAVCQLVGGEQRLAFPLEGFHNCVARPFVGTSSTAKAASLSTPPGSPPESHPESHPVPASFDWHIDGHHEHHRVSSPDVGLVCLWLLTPAPPGAGGTVFAPGSVDHVARLLLRSEPDGVPCTALHQADAREGEEGILEQCVLRKCRSVPPTDDTDMFVGDAGDVAFCHPFLVHRGALNVAATRARILGVSHCPLVDDLRHTVCKGEDREGRSRHLPLSPVEQGIADGLSGRRGGSWCGIS